MSAPRRVSVAIPVYNEEAVLPQLLARVRAVLDGVPGGPHELVFVDDGSRDGTRAMLEAEARRDPRMVVVALSRNFGHQAALSAAFDVVRGDCVLAMDADLQDAPEALPLLLARLDEGFDVVYVRRVARKETWWKRVSYHAAYRLISRMSDIDLPVDAGDFALMSRRVLEHVRSLPERERYLRGLRSWVGFRQASIEVARAERAAGDSKYSLTKLLRLALDGAFAFSVVPLRFTAVLGFAAMTGSGLFTLYAVYAKLVLGQSPQGFTAVIALLTFLSGTILISLWIIGEYLGRVYEEVKRRPIYIVDAITRGSDIRSP